MKPVRIDATGLIKVNSCSMDIDGHDVLDYIAQRMPHDEYGIQEVFGTLRLTLEPLESTWEVSSDETV